MTPRKKRLTFVLTAIVITIFTGYALVQILKSNLIYFYQPSELVAQKVAPDSTVRVGAMVVPNSLNKKATTINFTLTDGQTSIAVVFDNGVLPDLFGEGKGAVVKGTWDGKILHASEVLAKHDENYSPIALKNTPHEKKQ